jgi:hypothetical protein
MPGWDKFRRYHACLRCVSAVISGRREAASPESIITSGGYGFRAPSLRSGPGMTVERYGGESEMLRYGLKLGGIGGSSRIRVMVTRRLAAM